MKFRKQWCSVFLANKKTRARFCDYCVLPTTLISWLGWVIGRGGLVGRGRLISGLFIAAAVVVVVIMLPMAPIGIRPLQLSFECVILLAEILLPVVVGVAASVAPLECLVGGNVDVLEMAITSSVGAILAGTGNGEGAGPVRPGEGEGRHGGHQAGAHLQLYHGRLATPHVLCVD